MAQRNTSRAQRRTERAGASIIHTALSAGGKRLSTMARTARLRRQIAEDTFQTVRFSAAADGFESVAASRVRRSYGGSGGSADRHQQPRTLWRLRELCRAHVRDSSLMAGLVNRAADEIVGHTFEFKPVTADGEFNKAAAEHIRGRMDAAAFDWRGEIDYWQHLRLTLKALWTDGDVLGAFTTGGAVQTFEADELATPREAEGRDIVNGVEYAPDGRRAGYHVTLQRTKSDAARGWVPSLSETRRIPAGEAIFPRYVLRVNSTRGVPFLHGPLSIFDRLDGYIDSETLAAQISSNMVYLLTRAADDGSDLPGQSNYSDPNADGDTQKAITAALQHVPGMVLQGLPGEGVTTIGGDRPDNKVFEPYIITVARIFGVGVGMPLEYVLLDWSKTSYSSGKGALNVAHRSFRGWQRILTGEHCTPWYRRQIALAIAAGDLPVPRGSDGAPADPYRFEGIFPAWPYLDLQREAQADRLCVETGTKSRAQIIRSRGEDPERVFGEIEAESERFGRLQPQPVMVVENADEDVDGGNEQQATGNGQESDE